jgi:Flp pilus assembly protein TadD
MKTARKAARPISKGGEEKPGRSRGDWVLAAVLFFAIALAYLPVWHAGYIWDDDYYVTNNPLLTAPDGLRRIWFSLDSPSQYFPLTYTTFYLEHALWGFKPLGYHVINVFLHAANALLVWRLLARLRVPGAWLAAALFALHPVQVESVAWVTERKNVLMGLFFLLSLLSWTKFIDQSTKRPWRFYGLALVFYALALSAKTTACTLPAALLLFLWLKKMPIDRRRLAQVAPFVALGIGMGLVTIWWERFHQGTQGVAFSIGPLERVLIASRALFFYAGKLLWPAHLTFSYPHWTISATDPLAYGWLLGAAALGWVIWRARRQAGRGVEVAAVYFAATLSPMLGFIMLYTFVYSFVADHYQYLACLGPLSLAGAGMERGLARLAKKTPALKPLCCGLLMAALGGLTWAQCGQYADEETLWRATLAANPDCWLAHDDLGTIFRSRGNLAEAFKHFKMAAEINPADGKAHFGLGIILTKNGEVEPAIEQFRKVLEIQPNDAKARVSLGTLLSHQGKVAESIGQFRLAVELDPSLPQAREFLGLGLLQTGDFDSAMACFEKLIVLPPDPAQRWFTLANMLAGEGHLPEAMQCCRRALAISPRFADAWAGLGVLCLQSGQSKEAEDSWQKSLEINPAQPQVLNNLATLLATASDASLRDGAKAVALAEQASQLTGGSNAMIQCTLAAAYAEAGRYGEAAATVRKALSLAQVQKDDKLRRALEEGIQLYESGRPLRQGK